MAWGNVQSKSGGATAAATLSVTFTGTPVTGNKIIAAANDSRTANSPAVKDNAGASLTSLASFSGSPNGPMEGGLFAYDVPATPQTIIKYTVTTANDLTMLIQEVSGLLAGNTSAMCDGTPVVTNGGTLTFTNPTYSSTATNEYLVSAFMDNGGPETWATASGWAADANGINNSGTQDVVIASKNSTNGAENAAYVNMTGTACGWMCVLGAFKLAAAGSAAPPIQPAQPGPTWLRQFRKHQALQIPVASGPHNYTQSLSAGLSFTGTQPRAVGTGQAAGLSFTGAQTRSTSTHLVGGLSFTGALARRVGKGVTAGLSFTGTMPRAITKGLSAGLSFTGAQTRAIVHGLTATLSFTGSLPRRTSKGLTAALSFTGGFATQAVHFYQQSFTAGLSFTGSLTTQAVHHFQQAFTAGLSFAGSLPRQTGKGITAAVSFTGGMRRGIGTGLAAGLSFTGGMRKGISKRVASALSFIGNLVPAKSGSGVPVPPITVTTTTGALANVGVSSGTLANVGVTASGPAANVQSTDKPVANVGVTSGAVVTVTVR